MPRAPKDLTDRQQRFVAEYLVDYNATQAASRAGYGPQSSRRAYLLLRRLAVAAAVNKGMERQQKRLQVTADRVLKEYARIAFADIRSVVEWTQDKVTVKEGGGLTDDAAAAIAEIWQSGDKSRTRVRLHDKKRALEVLAKHLGLFGVPPSEDPKARLELADRAREMLLQRLTALAARRQAEKEAEGKDAAPKQPD